MPDAIEIDLSADGPHSIDAPDSAQVEGSFEVVLRNHGAPLHVHLRLDSSLGRVATVTAPNHYVDDGGVRSVRVEVEEGRLPAKGRLDVVTGYGAETEYVAVEIYEPGAVEPSVEVDERLGAPPRSDPEPLIEDDRVPAVAIAALALLVGLVAVVLVNDALVLALVLVAIAAVAIAAALVLV